MNYNFLIRYPFSSYARDLLKENDIDLFSIDESILKKSTIFLLKTINLDNIEKERQWHSYIKMDDKRVALTFVKIYPISKLLLKIIDLKQLNNQFANFYKEQFLYYLNNTYMENEFEIISRDIIPNYKYDQFSDRYYINLIDYLSFQLGDKFSLSYANLEDGNVFLTITNFKKLLSEIVYKKILISIDKDINEVPEIFKDYGESIRKKLVDNSEIINFKFENKPDVKNFPPCFLKMYNKIKAGQKPSHLENFYIAVFLYNVNYSYEEVLELFRNLPNFDEKIASYQIKKIFEKGYSVPNCKTLKLAGLCVNECNVKHPMQLFKFNKGEKNEKK